MFDLRDAKRTEKNLRTQSLFDNVCSLTLTKDAALLITLASVKASLFL